MKIAFTTTGDSLESPIDTRFGRAANFLVYDTDTTDFQVIDNSQNANAGQGAGIQSAQIIANAGVESLVTGHVGPNAFRVLQQAGIKIYQSEAPTIAQAIELFNGGSLQEANNADVRGHWT